jgi:hypothetical protein
MYLLNLLIVIKLHTCKFYLKPVIYFLYYVGFYRDKGIDGMREVYLSKQETLKVDCLIFVASASSVLPLNLMEAVKQVALQEDRGKHHNQ